MNNRNLIRIAALALLAAAAVIGAVQLGADSAYADPTGACFVRCKIQGGSTVACAETCFPR